MKLLYAIPFLLVTLVGATESKLKNGKIEFAVATVNEVVVWTEAEKVCLETSFDQFSATTPVITENLTPTVIEQALADSGFNFKNYSDFRNSADNKETLEDRLDDLPNSIKRKKASIISTLKAENNKR